MGTGTDQERLARLEANSETTMLTLARMETKLDEWKSNNYTKTEVDGMLELRDQRISTLEVARQNSRMSWPQWLLVAASFGSIITAAVAAFTR